MVYFRAIYVIFCIENCINSNNKFTSRIFIIYKNTLWNKYFIHYI